MKIVLWLVAAVLAFVLASSALWRMVGGLVQQAGTRDERTVPVDVRVTLVDIDGHPIAAAPVRLILGRDPQNQPATAGQTFVTDDTGSSSFTTRATIAKTARTRPTNWLDSLYATAEQTDHLTVAAELGYLTYRWLYVADLYRFTTGELVLDGWTLYTRDEQGRFSRKAEREGDGWKIADLGGARMTTLGYQLTAFSFDPTGAPDAWRLALTIRRDPQPLVR